MKPDERVVRVENTSATHALSRFIRAVEIQHAGIRSALLLEGAWISAFDKVSRIPKMAFILVSQETGTAGKPDDLQSYVTDYCAPVLHGGHGLEFFVR